MDAIVGKCGYVAMDGHRLSVYAHYASVRAKTARMRKLTKAGVVIQQEGDTEIGGWAPVERIEEALAAIRVCKMPVGNPSPDLGGLRRYQRRAQAADATQTAAT